MYQGVTTEDDGSEQRIPLDRPIISTTVAEVMDEARVKEISEVLRQWVALDRDNIVRRHAGMYWVLGPKRYNTNRPIPLEQIVGFFYWNPRNLEICKQNFGRAATAFRVVIRSALGPEGEGVEPFASPLRDLDQVLRSHVTCLDSLAIKVLNESVGLGLEWPGSSARNGTDEPPTG